MIIYGVLGKFDAGDAQMKKALNLFFILLLCSYATAVQSEQAKKGSSEANVLEIYAKYLTEAQFSDFPAEVVERAKYLILDSIGCAIGGAQTEIGKKFMNLAKSWSGGKEATLLGNGAKVSIMSAAYANTQLANLLDYDDTYDFYPPGHPGCTIIQTALAMAEETDASGKDFLTAVILGYEVCCRAGRAAGSILWGNTVNTSSDTLGATSAACRLLGLDCESAERALAFAARTQGGFPRPYKHDIPAGMVVPEVKGEYGQRALHGILAARQGQHGLTAWKTILDGDLKSWYLAGGNPNGYHILTEGLGTDYRILEVSFKPTPSCRWTHVPITAAWQALDQKPVIGDEIAEIVIKGVNRLQRYEWDSMLEAQFSTPCILALALIGKEPGPGWYTTGRFKDGDIRALAKKIKFEHDPKAEELELKTGKMICTVDIKFKDGTLKSASIDRIKGAPDNPMTDAELRGKFKANAISLIGETKLNKAIDVIMNLEKIKNVSILTAFLF